MKITVTQDHINRGIRQSLTGCPVALAIRDAAPDALAVRVNLWDAYVERKRFWFFTQKERFALPDEVRDFIYAFDQGNPVAPFSFDL